MASTTKRAPPNPWPARLKRLRREFCLTQAAAAAKIGVATRTWIGWENRHRRPRGPTVRLLGLVFGTAHLDS